MESHFLRETLKYGFHRLSDESATLKERAKSKDRLKWLKSQNALDEPQKPAQIFQLNKKTFLGV